MVNNVNHQIVGDVIQNHNESTTHTCQNGYHQKKKKNPQVTNVGKDVEKREQRYTSGGNVNWSSHCGRQYRSISKN